MNHFTEVQRKAPEPPRARQCELLKITSTYFVAKIGTDTKEEPRFSQKNDNAESKRTRCQSYADRIDAGDHAVDAEGGRLALPLAVLATRHPRADPQRRATWRQNADPVGIRKSKCKQT